MAKRRSNPAPTSAAAIRAATARAAFVQQIAALPDEARVGVPEAAAYFNKSPEGFRMALRAGLLNIPRAPESRGRRKLAFVMGSVRKAKAEAA